MSVFSSRISFPVYNIAPGMQKSMIETSMNRLESSLQALVEGSLARLFPSRTWQVELVQALTAALSADARLDRGGRVLAPDTFVIFLPPELVVRFENRPEMVEALTEYLTQAAQEAGFTFRASPSIRILPVPEAEARQVQVVAQFSLERSGQTASLNIPQQKTALDSAFLIVEGTRLFTLSESVTNIGRLPENHLILSDGRVSRRHAQIRLVRTQFMIFDLDSSGGTFVNGRRITQFVLQPGDVISLAGVPLVFGFDISENPSQTQEIIPTESES
jgi:hypothetical protein